MKIRVAGACVWVLLVSAPGCDSTPDTGDTESAAAVMGNDCGVQKAACSCDSAAGPQHKACLTGEKDSHGEPIVDPTQAFCIDPMSDANNCGRCGVVCGGTTPACVKGKCTDVATDRNNCGQAGNACDTGLQCCGGACVDTTSNASNCGKCGAGCGGTQPDTDTSVGTGACYDGTCTDTWADAQHCGQDRNHAAPCAEGQSCANGACQ